MIILPLTYLSPVEDLLYEDNLNLPILQIALGRFLPSSNELGIAVLHPRKLVVYELLPNTTTAGRTNYHELSKSYEHNLGIDSKHFSAYNMVVGPFGGLKDKDMILVQSMDGKLQFFHDTAFAFMCQLAECLIPGPIAYVRRIDAFVTCNYTCRAECYKYQVLASAQNGIISGAGSSSGDSVIEKNSMGLSSIRATLVEWSINLGETCRQILVGKFINDGKQNVREIIFLCDRNIFLVKDGGGIMQMRRLEKEPMCMASYLPGQGASSSDDDGAVSNFIIVNMDKSIQIFVDFTLAWAAMNYTQALPVIIGVCDIKGQKGLIATVDDEANLKLNYLGTKPPINAVASFSRDLDYDKIDEEHKKLLQVIRESQSDSRQEATERLILRAQMLQGTNLTATGKMKGGLSSAFDEIPNDIVSLNYAYNSTLDDALKVRYKITVASDGGRAIPNVTISVVYPSSIHVSPNYVHLDKLFAEKDIEFEFYALRNVPPTTPNVQIFASYLTSRGEPQSVSLSISLPLALFTVVKSATKSAGFKLVLDTEGKDPVPLTELFSDYLYLNTTNGVQVDKILGSTATHAFGFQFWFNENVTKVNAEGLKSSFSQPVTASILASKTNGRYRIQSDSMAACSYLCSEMDRRLCTFHGDDKSVVSYLDTLQIPLDEFLNAITDHYNYRLELKSLSKTLENLSRQYRAIQKRLLTRFKDKNPSPLKGLEILVRETYEKILESSDQIQEMKDRIKKSLVLVESMARMMVLLTSLKFKLSNIERNMLESYLCPNIVEGMDQGWEEIVDSSISYLLKSSLSMSEKESIVLPASVESQIDFEGFKKKLSTVFDRLSMGKGLISNNEEEGRK